MSISPHDDFASRAGQKLAHALIHFKIEARDLVCADLGANTGGFTDCLLRSGASKVYAVERGYGVLDYRLRQDARVVVLERTDALHLSLPEPVGLVTVDTGWTRQELILPIARSLLREGGEIVTLVKPHYEADSNDLAAGILPDHLTERTISPIRDMLQTTGLRLIAETESPIRGHGGNREFLWHLRPI